jgi:type IV pilus assembly protein PilV
VKITRRHRKPAAGFTIVEVIMAAVVMLAGVVGMMQVVISGSEMLAVSRSQTIAAQIIHSEIDKVHLVDWASLPSIGTTTFTPDTSFAPVTIKLNGATYRCTVTTVRADLKKITYTVSWRSNKAGNNGRVYSRSGSTYVDQNGLYVTYQRS